MCAFATVMDLEAASNAWCALKFFLSPSLGRPAHRCIFRKRKAESSGMPSCPRVVPSGHPVSVVASSWGSIALGCSSTTQTYSFLALNLKSFSGVFETFVLERLGASHDSYQTHSSLALNLKASAVSLKPLFSSVWVPPMIVTKPTPLWHLTSSQCL